MYTLAPTLYTTLAIHQQRSSYPFQAKVYNVYVCPTSVGMRTYIILLLMYIHSRVILN
jgi:hypothetical protein